MNFTIKKLPKSKIEIKVEISPKDFDKYINQTTLNLGKNIEVEGFRKGKAPKEIIEEKAGKGNILVDAADLAIKENYKKIILENRIAVISEPKIDILKLAPGNEFVFRAEIEVLPEIRLPDYKKIASEVKRNKIFTEEKEVEDSLKWLRKSRAKFTIKNSPAQIGDFVEIEYWSFTFLQEKVKDAFILGEGHFIPKFEEELIGMKAGEEKEKILITVPETHFQKNQAGKTVELKVRMNSVKIVEFPEINDEFARNLGNFEDLNALKKNIKEGIKSEKSIAESKRVRDEILEKISREIEVEVPEVLIEREKKQMLEDVKESISRNLKISFNEYLDRIKKTEKELMDSFLPWAQKRVKNLLILREIGNREKVEVSEAEITDEINKILKHYPSAGKTREEIDPSPLAKGEGIDPEKLKLYTEGAIRTEKIFVLLESFVEKT